MGKGITFMLITGTPLKNCFAVLKKLELTCSIAMGDRLMVPKTVKEESLRIGEFAYRRNYNMLIIRLRDKIKIFFLYTIHNMAVSKPVKGIKMMRLLTS